jgi:hypothetical protein
VKKVIKKRSRPRNSSVGIFLLRIKLETGIIKITPPEIGLINKVIAKKRIERKFKLKLFFK